MLFWGNFLVLSVYNTNAYTYQYSANSSVTYEINYQMNYTLLEMHASTAQVWFPRIENWTESDTSNNTQIQKSQLKSIATNANPENYTFTESDIYGNSYYFFVKSIPAIGAGSRQFQIEYNYTVTLNSASWDIPTNITLDGYDLASPFYKLYTSSQPFLEVNDTLIQSAATEIAGLKQSVVEKAKAIYLYLVKDMNYKLQAEALGAKTALETKKGDCSEFSSLMVALLRAQGIPARKVLGFGVVSGDIATPQPLFDPKMGSAWNYSKKDGNLPGHAWVQYYVPRYGWISSDPTWGQALYNSGSSTLQKEQLALEYFNRIDTCHLITTIGDWYGEGINPEIPFQDGGIAEFPFFLPYWSLYNDWNLQISFVVTNKTIGTTGSSDSDFFSWFVIGGSGALMLFLIFYAYFSKKSRENRARTPRYIHY